MIRYKKKVMDKLNIEGSIFILYIANHILEWQSGIARVA
jgi:hypothetical protein